LNLRYKTKQKGIFLTVNQRVSGSSPEGGAKFKSPEVIRGFLLLICLSTVKRNLEKNRSYLPGDDTEKTKNEGSENRLKENFFHHLP
jgi:hypothetical protein